VLNKSEAIRQGEGAKDFAWKGVKGTNKEALRLSPVLNLQTLSLQQPGFIFFAPQHLLVPDKDKFMDFNLPPQ
jgi:hypothetical protein